MCTHQNVEFMMEYRGQFWWMDGGGIEDYIEEDHSAAKL